MAQKLVQANRPRSSASNNAREAAPISQIEEQYSKFEQELMDPKSFHKIVEIIEEIEKSKSKLEEYSKNLKGDGAKKYLQDVKKYGESLIRSYGAAHLQLLYNSLLEQTSSENIAAQKKRLQVVVDFMRKYFK